MPSRPWRKLWHLSGGSFFPVLALLVPQDILLATLGAVTAVLVTGEIIRLSAPGVNRRLISRLGGILKETEKSRPTGITYLLLGSLAVFLLFDKYIAITALFFLAIGDVVATVIGEKFGQRRVFHKSGEGSLACLASCLLTGTVIARINGVITMPTASLGAVSATLAELLPLPVDDNLSIPLSSAGTMTLTTLYFR